MAKKNEEYTLDDQIRYQRIYKGATASPAEQREEKARSRKKVTERASKKLEVTGKKIKGEMDKDLARLEAIKRSQQEADKTFKRKQQMFSKTNKKFGAESKYIQPRKVPAPMIGSPRSDFTIKGGAGPTGKRLKRI